MKCEEIIKLLEQLSPLCYAEDWDNPGLLAGRMNKEVHKIMTALDASLPVVLQAAEWGADMLISHHPMVIRPIKSVTDCDFIGKKLVTLIGKDISYYAMHTNFDCSVMAEEAGKRLGLHDIQVLQPYKPRLMEGAPEGVGLGCIGIFDQAVTAQELAQRMKSIFGVPYVTYTGSPKDSIVKVAMCPGGGKSVVGDAISCGADVYITGDITHHTALDAKEQGLEIMDATHFGTEHFMAEYMKQYLLEHVPGIEVEIATEEAVMQLI